jgi:hypothetical protein
MIDRFKQYGEQVRQGHPVSGLVNEFNTMMMKMFPTKASYGTNESNSIPDSGMNGTSATPAPVTP